MLVFVGTIIHVFKRFLPSASSFPTLHVVMKFERELASNVKKEDLEKSQFSTCPKTLIICVWKSLVPRYYLKFMLRDCQ